MPIKRRALRPPFVALAIAMLWTLPSRAGLDEYVKKLGGVIKGQSDVIGFAFAVNGKINSADVYVSNSLFKKLWLKMLKASATEAVSASREIRLAAPVQAAAVKGFMDDSDRAAFREQSVGAGSRLVTRSGPKPSVPV